MVKLRIAKSENVHVPASDSEPSKRLAEVARASTKNQSAHYLTHAKMCGQHLMRFLPLSQLCHKHREKKRLTLRQISSKLDVHFYELHLIEQCCLKEINFDTLKKYVAFLGIEQDFDKWASENDDIVESMSCDA